MLARWDTQKLRELLLPVERFAPFPRADDRAGWAAVAPHTRDAWLALAEQHAGYEWPAVRVRDYRTYWTDGNVMNYVNRLFERRTVLGIMTMAECMEGKGRFMEQIVDGIYAICEETTWVPPLHRLHAGNELDECMPEASDHAVELMTATTADLLVWIHYLLRAPLDNISIRIGRRIEREVRERLMVPYMQRSDYWWMGFREGVRVNNWNPWCNSCVLMVFLLLETDAAARAEGVGKAMRSLDAFIRTYPSDGCCDEGPMYWGAAGGGLLASLELLAEASGGRIDLFDDPLVRDIGTYIAKVHIHDAYYAAFADGDARAGIGGNLVYRYGRCIGDQALMQLGASILPDRMPVPGLHNWFGLYGYLRDVFGERERLSAERTAPYVRDTWFPVTQVMTAREQEGSERGLYVAAKGGHNGESHNHNDIGSFLVFADGCPLIIDPGTESYKAQTFGPDRYQLWYLQSKYHNLPTVRGIGQKEGKVFRARDVHYRQNDERSELRLNLAEAYPAEAGIVRWVRTVSLDRDSAKRRIEVTDDFELKEPACEIEYSLMTPCLPEVTAPGEIRLPYAVGLYARLCFDAEFVRPVIETIELGDQRLKNNWGERIFRIVLTEKTARMAGIRTLTIRLNNESGE
ncbi:heparinase II/III family protein [Paenibacillus sp. GCM10027626]|uniref:heparinase II/III domain-containing protein n=1 Tax=Paenibacillus sp. GCM10027626 TaxID=3273411 RepID=UPI00363F494A